MMIEGMVMRQTESHLTEEYRSRVYALLELYARPISHAEPFICIDEKSL